MAISNVATAGQQGMGSTVLVTNQARISLDLDAAYATGGYPSFVATSVKGLLGTKITVLNIEQVSPGGGYDMYWDRANDTLLVYQSPTALGVKTQVPNMTNLAAITGVEFIVTYV